MDYTQILDRPEYSFINENEHLGNNIILLTLSGSIAYGTNTEHSDIDIKGAALERPNELLGLDSFEQYEDENTDTTIYGLRKLVRLLTSCNPNCIEILATNPEHILRITAEGQKLRDNISLFLSQRAAQSFAGYAAAQLRRLQNALARDTYPPAEKEQHILNSIKHQLAHFTQKYQAFEFGSIKPYIGQYHDSVEILVDINLQQYPLRDYKNMWSEMYNVIRDYDTLGKRNKKKDDQHLFKHAMHLIRMLLMGRDIMEGKAVQTYRPERELLLAIRQQKYTFPQLFEMVDKYEQEFAYAVNNSSLPATPNYQEINELVIEINKKVLIC